MSQLVVKNQKRIFWEERIIDRIKEESMNVRSKIDYLVFF